MKIQKRALHQALTQINKATSPKASLQIIQTVKLTAHNEKLTILGTDLNNYLRVDLHCTGEDFESCIAARPLLQLVRPEGKTDKGTVTVTMVGNTLAVESDGIVTWIPTLPADGFPEPEDDNWRLAAVWPGKEFLNSLQFVSRAASDDCSRPHICSVYIDNNFLVATNGHQLHKAPVPTPFLTEVLLSTDTVNLLLNILKLSDQMFIALSDDQVRIQVGSYTLQAKLKEEQFPPYEMVIPKRQKSSVTLKTAGFLRAMKHIAAVSAKAGGMKMTLNGALELSVDSNLGAASVDVPLLENGHHGDVFVAGFNQELITTSLMTDAEQVTLSMESPLDPLVITDNRDRLAVVMPMRI